MVISIQPSYLYPAKSSHPFLTQLKSISSMNLFQPILHTVHQEEEKVKERAPVKHLLYKQDKK